MKMILTLIFKLPSQVKIVLKCMVVFSAMNVFIDLTCADRPWCNVCHLFVIYLSPICHPKCFWK